MLLTDLVFGLKSDSYLIATFGASRVSNAAINLLLYLKIPMGFIFYGSQTPSHRLFFFSTSLKN